MGGIVIADALLSEGRWLSSHTNNGKHVRYLQELSLHDIAVISGRMQCRNCSDDNITHCAPITCPSCRSTASRRDNGGQHRRWRIIHRNK